MSRERFYLEAVGDRELLVGLLKLNQASAEVTADLLCHLAEVDRRKLYVAEGCSSLWSYVVEVLGCTEDEASRRIHAARVGERLPVVFDRVARGDLTLIALSRLSKHLTQANHVAVLAEAKGKTLREIDELVARLAPKPDVATRVVRQPERSASASAAQRPAASAVSPGLGQLAGTADVAAPTSATASAPLATEPRPAAGTFALTAPAATAVTTNRPSAPRTQTAPRSERSRIEPLSPGRWGVHMTIGAAARQALNKALDLSAPGCDEAEIVERAVLEYVDRLEARRHGKLGRGKRPPVVPAKDSTRSPRSHEVPTDASASTSRSPEVADASASTSRSPEVADASASTSRSPEVADASASTSRSPGVADASAPTLRSPEGPSPDTRLHVAKHVANPRPTANQSDAPDRRRRPSRAVMRAVRERDGGRCTFVSADGRRCSCTARLQYHHIHAWAFGGETTADQLCLRCRVHHQQDTLRDFGAAHIARAIARRRRQRAPEETGDTPALEFTENLRAPPA